jgi:transcriptional regulator with PAS, ATPase and Fis domain
MFFSRKTDEDAKKRMANNEETSRRFAEKLAAITEINAMITEAVVTTQAANTELLDKLKKHLKNGSSSFKSLSDKLLAGVIVLDYRGTIMQSNPKAREILRCGNTCIGSHISDLVSEILPIFPSGDYISMIPEFFENLSDIIYSSIGECPLGHKNECIMSCLKEQELPIKADVQQLVQVTSPLLSSKPYMKFTFSVLGNEPVERDDIAYVMVFSISKKTSEGGIPARRATD